MEDSLFVYDRRPGTPPVLRSRVLGGERRYDRVAGVTDRLSTVERRLPRSEDVFTGVAANGERLMPAGSVPTVRVGGRTVPPRYEVIDR